MRAPLQACSMGGSPPNGMVSHYVECSGGKEVASRLDFPRRRFFLRAANDLHRLRETTDALVHFGGRERAERQAEEALAAAFREER